MMIIDKYSYTNKLKDINPSIKIAAGFLSMIISMILNNLYVYAFLIMAMSLSIVILAKVDFKDYIKLIKIPIYFLLVGVVMILINFSDTDNIFILNVKIFNMYIGISKYSLETSTYLVLRSMSCLTCIYFITLTTSFNQIIYTLNKLKISSVVIELIVLVYRFIFIFLEEYNDIYKAQNLRFGYVNLKTSYKSISLLINTLFFRMMKRYDDMVISLDTKLYDGKFHV